MVMDVLRALLAGLPLPFGHIYRCDMLVRCAEPVRCDPTGHDWIRVIGLNLMASLSASVLFMA